MSAGEGAFPSMLVPWRRCDTLWSVSSCLFALAMDGVCFLNLYFHFRMASLFTVVTVMKDQSSEAFVEGSYLPPPHTHTLVLKIEPRVLYSTVEPYAQLRASSWWAAWEQVLPWNQVACLPNPFGPRSFLRWLLWWETMFLYWEVWVLLVSEICFPSWAYQRYPESKWKTD